MKVNIFIKYSKQVFGIILLVMSLISCNLNDDSVVIQNSGASSEYYLNKAESVESQQEKNGYYLLAAQAMLNENKSSMAKSLLDGLTNLDSDQEQDKNITLANIYANLTKDDKVAEILQTLDVNNLNNTQLSLYYKASSKVYINKKDYINAIIDLDKQYNLLDSKQDKLANTNSIWNLLLSMNSNAIQNAKNNAQNDTILFGWLELIDIYQNNLSKSDQLPNLISDWQRNNPDHPASIDKPTALNKISNYSVTNTQKIALLLPMTGNFSKVSSVIKAGFDDANNNKFPVEYYDTNTQSISEIISNANMKGVTNIVGPLLKPEVKNLIDNGISGVNVLTLNADAANNKPVENVCYFGLLPEVEARDAVEFMWSKGIRNPVVLIVNNDVGVRSAEIFKQYWQNKSNNQISVKVFSNEDNLKNILTEIVSNSQNSPIDAFYIVGNNTELLLAKSIVSTNQNLVNIPIYASSRSNSSNNTQSFGMSMSGVSFSDVSLLENPNASVYKKAMQVANNDYTLARLYALGYDALNLSTKVSEMKNIAGFSLQGLTGRLKADANCTIERKMSWFKYNNGLIDILQ